MRDAILIPGGGVRAGGALPLWVERRFERALAVQDGGEHLICLSAGTPHRPSPLDERGFAISEAHAGARWLLARGFPRERILVEPASWDTIGNAFFSRVIHVIPRAFARALVITSAFHMPRTESAFRWVYGLEGAGARCELEFEATPDDGIEPDALAARVSKERQALESLERLKPRCRNLAELHRWLFTEHGAYCAGAPGFAAPTNAPLESY